MARPRRTDEQLVTSARQVVQQTQDILELRQALAVLVPAELNASLEQTARVLGVGRATVPRLQSGFRRRRRAAGGTRTGVAARLLVQHLTPAPSALARRLTPLGPTPPRLAGVPGYPGFAAQPAEQM